MYFSNVPSLDGTEVKIFCFDRANITTTLHKIKIKATAKLHDIMFPIEILS